MSRNKLIIVLVVVFGVLLIAFLSRGESDQQTSSNQSVSPTRLPPSLPQTTLRFDPNPIKLDKDGKVHAKIYMDTKENKVSAVQLELAYDPKVLSFVSIEPEDFFANRQEIIKRIDAQRGRITYAVGITPQQRSTPIQGEDTIVEIVFTPVSSTVKETNITFLPHTMVTALGIQNSVLRKTTNGNVLIEPQ